MREGREGEEGGESYARCGGAGMQGRIRVRELRGVQSLSEYVHYGRDEEVKACR